MLSRSRPTALSLTALALSAALVAAGCSGGGDRRDTTVAAAVEDAATGTADDTTGSGDAAADDSWDVSAADVDAYVRSVEVQTDSMRATAARMRGMPQSKARDSAYLRVTLPSSFSAAMVQASGMTEDRYTETAGHLENAYLAVTGGADQPTVAETMRRLRPGVGDAVKKRAPRITELREEQRRLVAQAGGFEKLMKPK